jgi:hypothetical protein
VLAAKQAALRFAIAVTTDAEIKDAPVGAALRLEAVGGLLWFWIGFYADYDGGLKQA